MNKENAEQGAGPNALALSLFTGFRRLHFMSGGCRMGLPLGTAIVLVLLSSPGTIGLDASAWRT